MEILCKRPWMWVMPAFSNYHNYSVNTVINALIILQWLHLASLLLTEMNLLKEFKHSLLDKLKMNAFKWINDPIGGMGKILKVNFVLVSKKEIKSINKHIYIFNMFASSIDFFSTNWRWYRSILQFRNSNAL